MATIIEIDRPTYRHDYDGNIISTEWDVTPPPGFDDSVDEHECAAGDQCAGAYKGRGMTVGFRLVEHEDGRSGAYWTAWMIDGRWVVCEDCANAIDAGDLTVTIDDEWEWVE